MWFRNELSSLAEVSLYECPKIQSIIAFRGVLFQFPLPPPTLPHRKWKSAYNLLPAVKKKNILILLAFFVSLQRRFDRKLLLFIGHLPESHAARPEVLFGLPNNSNASVHCRMQWHNFILRTTQLTCGNRELGTRKKIDEWVYRNTVAYNVCCILHTAIASYL